MLPLLMFCVKGKFFSQYHLASVRCGACSFGRYCCACVIVLVPRLCSATVSAGRVVVRPKHEIATAMTTILWEWAASTKVSSVRVCMCVCLLVENVRTCAWDVIDCSPSAMNFPPASWLVGVFVGS